MSKLFAKLFSNSLNRIFDKYKDVDDSRDEVIEIDIDGESICEQRTFQNLSESIPNYEISAETQSFIFFGKSNQENESGYKSEGNETSISIGQNTSSLDSQNISFLIGKRTPFDSFSESAFLDFNSIYGSIFEDQDFDTIYEAIENGNV